MLIHYCCSFLYGDSTFSLKCIIFCELWMSTRLVFEKQGVRLVSSCAVSQKLLDHLSSWLPMMWNLFPFILHYFASFHAHLLVHLLFCAGWEISFFPFLLRSDRKLWSQQQSVLVCPALPLLPGLSCQIEICLKYANFSTVRACSTCSRPV